MAVGRDNGLSLPRDSCGSPLSTTSWPRKPWAVDRLTIRCGRPVEGLARRRGAVMLVLVRRQDHWTGLIAADRAGDAPHRSLHGACHPGRVFACERTDGTEHI